MSSSDGPIVFFSLFALGCLFWSYTWLDSAFAGLRISAMATLVGFVASALIVGFFMATSKPAPKVKIVVKDVEQPREYQ